MTTPTITLPYTFSDTTPNSAPRPIVAAQINANFNALQIHASGNTETTQIPVTQSITLTTLQANFGGFEFTGNLTQNITVTWPANFIGFASINNGTVGGFTITCGFASGPNVVVLNGSWVLIWSDGSQFIALGGAVVAPQTTGTGPFVLENTPTINSPLLTGTVTGTNAIPNAVLQHSSITIGGQTVSLGGSISGQSTTVVAKTANYQILTTDTPGTIFVTDGAANPITFTLPATVAGSVFGFAATAQQVQVDAPAGSTITLPLNPNPDISSSGGNILSQATDSFIYLTAISATNWEVTANQGLWITDTNGTYGMGNYGDGLYGIGGI